MTSLIKGSSSAVGSPVAGTTSGRRSCWYRVAAGPAFTELSYLTAETMSTFGVKTRVACCARGQYSLPIKRLINCQTSLLNGE